MVTIEDFYEAAEKLTDAFDAWRHGNHTGAIRIAEEALGSIKEGLGEFHEMLEGCREMEKLAERIGGVVAKLENVLGEVRLRGGGHLYVTRNTCTHTKPTFWPCTDTGGCRGAHQGCQRVRPGCEPEGQLGQLGAVRRRRGQPYL